jgi:Uri superfamily endonuclease
MPGTLPYLLATSLPSGKGSYLLLFRNPGLITVTAGKRLRFGARPGWYLYAGSALGPGGLAARLSHHCRPSLKPRWHVDYLKESMRLAEIWLLQEEKRCECALAQAARNLSESRIPCPGFGSSDCKCESHLVHFPVRPDHKAFTHHLAMSGTSPAILGKLRVF